MNAAAQVADAEAAAEDAKAAGLDSTAEGAVTLSGSIAKLNAALASLVYRGGHDYSGPDLLRISVSDGSQSTKGSVALTVVSIAQQDANLRTQVAGLQSAGVLNKGPANSLEVIATIS